MVVLNKNEDYILTTYCTQEYLDRVMQAFPELNVYKIISPLDCTIGGVKVLCTIQTVKQHLTGPEVIAKRCAPGLANIVVSGE